MLGKCKTVNKGYPILWLLSDVSVLCENDFNISKPQICVNSVNQHTISATNRTAPGEGSG